MKILHTSDLHIGLSLFGEDMLTYQQRLLDLIIRADEENHIDCIIIAGDIFDSAIVSAQAVKCWDKLLSGLYLHNKNTSVIIISGNHDSAARLSVNSDLLKMLNITISGSFRDFLTPVVIGDTEIYLIPYFNLSEVREFFGDDTIKSCTEAFKLMTDKIRENWNESSCHVIAAHCFVTGASVSESERASKGAIISAGGAQMVSADVFERFDYVALGHLHNPQTIKCSADNSTIVRYSGTPIAYSFSEAEHPKSMSLYDTHLHTLEQINLEPLVNLITVKGTYDEIMSRENTAENAYVRVIITDRTSPAGLYEGIRDKYPNMLRLECSESTGTLGSHCDEQSIAEMSVYELAGQYLSEMFGQNITQNQLNWLELADKSDGE